MSFEVSFDRGNGRSLEPRIPGTAAAKKAKAAATASTKPPPAKARAQSSYWDVLCEIEGSVSNPPPCEHGMTAECTTWLTENAKQDDVVTLPCGMSYKVLARGREKAKKSPKVNTPVMCHYRGFLHDGTEFDSSYGRGQPFEFVPADMIQGWTVVSAQWLPAPTPPARRPFRALTPAVSSPQHSHRRCAARTLPASLAGDAAHGRGRYMGTLRARAHGLW